MNSHPAGVSNTAYYPVSTSKFVLLSLITFGLYELYWFWKNWRFIKDRDGSNILPWGRALFAPFWYPVLLSDINRTAPSGRPFRGLTVFLLSGCYFVLAYAGGLPDPIWILGFGSLLPLLPAMRAINHLNPPPNADYERHSAWKLRHALLGIVAVPCFGFAIASSMLLIPSTEVIPGALFWGPGRAFVERNILEGREEIEYFYSDASFSFRADGNILTSDRAISYWEDEYGEFYIASARFADIAEIKVHPGSWMGPMIVTIIRNDGEEFDLYLPAGERTSRRLVERLRQHIRSQTPAVRVEPTPDFERFAE